MTHSSTTIGIQYILIPAMEVFGFVEMSLSVGSAPHWIGVHDGDVIPLLDGNSCSNLKQ